MYYTCDITNERELFLFFDNHYREYPESALDIPQGALLPTTKHQACQNIHPCLPTTCYILGMYNYCRCMPGNKLNA